MMRRSFFRVGYELEPVNGWPPMIPISSPVQSISKHGFATGIEAALEAEDYAKAKRLVRLWLGYLEDSNVF